MQLTRLLSYLTFENVEQGMEGHFLLLIANLPVHKYPRLKEEKKKGKRRS